jgi:hypothetical protein
MRKLVFAAIALATLGGAAVTSADAEPFRPGYYHTAFDPPFCAHRECGHGPVLPRVCEAWEIFGGERHCVRWRYVQ